MKNEYLCLPRSSLDRIFYGAVSGEGEEEKVRESDERGGERLGEGWIAARRSGDRRGER